MPQIISPSKVTIVIPTYGHAQFIAQCLESVLDQKRSPAQILVINDGSPDGTDDAVAPYLRHIHYLKQTNHGLTYTFNRGLSMVRTDYMMFLGSDDWINKTALEALESILDRHPDVAVAHANRWKVDQDGGIMETQDIPYINKYDALPSIAQSNYIFSPVIMMRTAARQKADPVPDFPYCRDWAVYIKMALQGWKFYGVPERLGYYRRHSNNTTHERHAEAILINEIEMLRWALTTNNVLPELQRVVQDSIRARLKNLGWLYLDAHKWDIAQETFSNILRERWTEWNVVIGLAAALNPRLVYLPLRNIWRVRKDKEGGI